MQNEISDQTRKLLLMVMIAGCKTFIYCGYVFDNIVDVGGD